MFLLRGKWKKILKEFAVEADTVLDPVLVCHKEVYDFWRKELLSEYRKKRLYLHIL